MLPCLHTQGTFVLPHVPDVHCCSICSVPVFSPVESRSMEPLSKRPHVDCEPVEPRLLPARSMFPPPPPAMLCRAASAAEGPSAPLLSSAPTAEEMQLVSMGFHLDDVRAALRRAGGNVEAAVSALLGDAPPAAPPVPPAPAPLSNGGFPTKRLGSVSCANTDKVFSAPPMPSMYARHNQRTYEECPVAEDWEELMDDPDADQRDIADIVESMQDGLMLKLNDTGSLLHNAIHRGNITWVEEIMNVLHDDVDDENVWEQDETPLKLACRMALDEDDNSSLAEIVEALLPREETYLQTEDDRPVQRYLARMIGALKDSDEKSDKMRIRMREMTASNRALQAENKGLLAQLALMQRDLNASEARVEELMEGRSNGELEVKIELAEEGEEEEGEEDGVRLAGEDEAAGSAAAAAAAVAVAAVAEEVARREAEREEAGILQ